MLNKEDWIASHRKQFPMHVQTCWDLSTILTLVVMIYMKYLQTDTVFISRI